MMGGPLWKFVIFFLVISFLMPLFWNMFNGSAAAGRINYSTFRSQLEQNNVTSITVKGNEISGVLSNGIPDIQGSRDFVTYIPSFGDDRLMPLLEERGVAVRTEPESEVSPLGLILNLLPFLIFIWLGYTIYKNMRTQGQNVFSIGKSRAKLYEKRKEKTSFDDVAGVEGAKGEVKEIVEFLKDPSKFHRLGAKTPRGVLLVGPPGTGKTLLARAIAGEAEVPFYSISGSDFMEMFVGVGASRVRNLFAEAKKSAPSIIFIDELDSIGRRRGAGLGGGHDEREQTLNQMLSEMDGFERNTSVIVLAATNRPDILDPALLRPGRFDRRITVDLPTLEDRHEILKIHARSKPLTEGVDLNKIAQGTPGFSGADLENLLNEAALIAARNDKSAIEMADIDEARDKVMMGLERKSLKLMPEDKRLVAVHEAGHAVLAALLPNTDPLHKVTIIPRDRAMGVTQQMPERDQYVYKKEYLLDRITVMLGGRAAEQIFLGTITSGAENDLKQATKIARKMVLDWGMSKKLGHMAFSDPGDNVFLGEEIAHRREYSDSTAREIDNEVRDILEDSYRLAVQLLKQQEDGLNEVTRRLLEREQLLGAEVIELIRNGKSPASKNGQRGSGNGTAEPAGSPEEAQEEAPQEHRGRIG